MIQKMRRVGLGCALLLAWMAVFALPALAATKTTEIVTTQKKQDLAVMFTFDKEVVDLTFLSPSGGRKTGADSDVSYTSGDLWSSYRITDAEPGTWSVECDLKSNTSINYSIIEDNYGLWIQYVTIASRDEEKATVTFRADCETETLDYNFTITAVDTADAGNRKELSSGMGRSGQEHAAELDLTGLVSGNYVLELSAYYKAGDAELFDSYDSEAFDYTNPEVLDTIEDFAATVNVGGMKCTVAWDRWTREASEYRLQVTADDKTVYDSKLPGSVTSSGVVFPEGTQRLKIALSYGNGGPWSVPLEKNIDLTKEYLRLNTADVTAAGQVVLAYKTGTERTLYVTLDEEEGEYNIDGEATLSFDLPQSDNAIEAYFEAGDNITFYAASDIYYDTHPAEIKLYEDLDGKTFYDAQVQILGKVNGGSKLLVNGVESALDEHNEFNISVPLQLGENVVSLEAANANGNASAMKLTLYRRSRMGGDGTAHTGWKQFIPLIVALMGSTAAVLLALVLMYPRDKNEPRQPSRLWKWVLWDVVAALLEAGLVVGFVACYRYNRSTGYLELAEKSAAAAAGYLRAEHLLMAGALVGVAVLIASIVLTILAVQYNRRNRP